MRASTEPTKFIVTVHGEIRLRQRDLVYGRAYDPIKITRKAWRDGREPSGGFKPDAAEKPDLEGRPDAAHLPLFDRFVYRQLVDVIFVFGMSGTTAYLLTVYKDVYQKQHG